MSDNNQIKNELSYLGKDLLDEVLAHSVLKEVPRDSEILREGQYVKVIPIVLRGLMKVYTRHEDKELLLYYIQPNESCIMSFAAGMKNNPSRVFAQAEEDSTVLLLPVDKVADWTRRYSKLNSLFFQQYNLRYSELLDTINHVLFDKLDKRLLDYLRDKRRLTRKNPIKISHRQIASELGTSREVISRVMKKLEHESLVVQQGNSIKICE